MSILLQALSVPDASAIVEIDGHLRLVRPPFTISSSPELSNADLNEAVSRGSYEKLSKEFSGFAELVKFLRSNQQEWLDKVGFPKNEALSADEFISEVDTEIVDDILSRIEKELLPAGLHEQAELLLLAIVKSDKFEKQKAIKIRAVQLLSQSHASRSEARDDRLQVPDRRFVTLQKADVKKRIRSIKAKIQRRGCLLEVRAET